MENDNTSYGNQNGTSEQQPRNKLFTVNEFTTNVEAYEGHQSGDSIVTPEQTATGQTPNPPSPPRAAASLTLAASADVPFSPAHQEFQAYNNLISSLVAATRRESGQYQQQVMTNNPFSGSVIGNPQQTNISSPFNNDVAIVEALAGLAIGVCAQLSNQFVLTEEDLQANAILTMLSRIFNINQQQTYQPLPLLPNLLPALFSSGREESGPEESTFNMTAQATIPTTSIPQHLAIIIASAILHIYYSSSFEMHESPPTPPARTMVTAPDPPPTVEATPNKSDSPREEISNQNQVAEPVGTKKHCRENDPQEALSPPTVKILSIEERDADELSPYQCLVRKQIELFEQPKCQFQKEITIQGRNRPVIAGQVGIRCRHCGHTKNPSRGAVFFPSTLMGVYQAAQNMANSHLIKVCKLIPEDTRKELLEKRSREKGRKTCKSAYGGGRQYWANALRVHYVVDSKDRRLRFQRGAVCHLPQESQRKGT